MRKLPLNFFPGELEQRININVKPPCKMNKIGAKVVRHSRYVTFQMAEVAIGKKNICPDIVSDRTIALLFCLTTPLLD